MLLCILLEASIFFCLNPFVIIIINIFIYSNCKFFKGCIVFFESIIHFCFYSSKECFHDAIIVTIPFSRHKLNYSVFLQPFSKINMLILPSLVLMENQTFQLISFFSEFFDKCCFFALSSAASQFDCLSFEFVTVTHKNTPFTGCPVKGGHIKTMSI